MKIYQNVYTQNTNAGTNQEYHQNRMIKILQQKSQKKSKTNDNYEKTVTYIGKMLDSD